MYWRLTSSLPRWPQSHITYIFLAALLIPTAYLSSLLYSHHVKPPQVTYSDLDDSYIGSARIRPPHISAKIWQIYLTHGLAAAPKDNLYTWISHSPSYAYTMVDAQEADNIIYKLSQIEKYAQIQLMFSRMTRRVMRADFLRYLILATEGGVYSDIDTRLIRPIDEWVPGEYKDRTRLVIALEVDQSPPAKGTVYDVQFCQWTVAAAPNHPVLWNMVDRILGNMSAIANTEGYGHKNFTDQDILNITGPVGWTEAIYEYLSNITDTTMTWKNITGIKHPILYDDVLILPLEAFRTSLVQHLFSGSWKKGWV